MRNAGSKHFSWIVLILAVLSIVISPASAAEDSQADKDDAGSGPDVKWQRGPCVSNLGDIADIHVPGGYVFAGAEDTRRLMEYMENPPSGDELGFIGPTDSSWFLVFEFDNAGYVKDDEKSSLDADALLKTLTKGNDAGNEERRRRGWTTLTLLGWAQKPRYNSETHNLEWATRLKDDGASEDISVNFNTRLLGRRGVMEVTLVADQKELENILPRYNELIGAFSFKPGSTYAEFVKGDKVAKYGLTALIAGGAGAVAAKAGVFKYLWKLLVVGAVAVASFAKKLFGRKGSSKSQS